MSGSILYVGGAFTNIGGQPRNHIAALDVTTGTATAWHPDADGSVLALAASGLTVYAGGAFTSIGGKARGNIAALDVATGTATDWNPNADGDIRALAVTGSTVYAGGAFYTIGGLPQSNLAAILADATTPTLLSLVSARATIDGVKLTWSARAGYVSRAPVYRRTERTTWDPIGEIRADGTGHFTYEDRRVIAGTRYGYRLGVMESGREIFLGETWVDVPVTPGLELASRGNPVRDRFSVEFSLPTGSPAQLELYDLGGRRMLSREVGTLGTGRHVMTLGDGQTLAPGVYLLRLSQGTRSIMARAVIVR